ncbi:histidine phosphatase family protein [uncultured Paenibacillus sp.]|uniref:histidine phosphatase family protein n=1 Tax=uncultured Paenibacillus sp. TaxID=227322 RepID=UPI0028D6771C|nr:histidine phosphatase family protein [uncultured Paenibacillus sp.]
MIKIGFIRHGTTEWNLLGRMQGQMDTPLAEEGRTQALLLAHRLEFADWDGMLSSDLIRAQETAELVSRSSGIPFWGADARLRERGFGEHEGTTLAERVERWGDNWRQVEVGREPIESVLARWDSFFYDMGSNRKDKRVLIVSHGGFIEPVLVHRFGAEVPEHLANASLSVTVLDLAEWRCDLLNCTKHLEHK